MRFTEEKTKVINELLAMKRTANATVKVKLGTGVNGTSAFKQLGNCDWTLCEVEEIPAIINELTMLKEAIEEETGIILR